MLMYTRTIKLEHRKQPVGRIKIKNRPRDIYRSEYH